MVPNALADWTYETIGTLCAAGQCESDRHDFKLNLPDPVNMTKICCAFANTFGGFVVLGVRDKGSKQFEIVGLDPDKELYAKLVAKVRADPNVAISTPKTIDVPSSAKLLYVFEIPQSPRRPHLPSPVDERVFWKRQGPACVQMTLEEIRYQMNTYEEKREKLALLLIDLQHKLRSVSEQAAFADGQYNGDMFSFETIDRVVVEAYAILKADVNIFGKLDTLKRRLMLLNFEKQQMLGGLTQVFSADSRRPYVRRYRDEVRKLQPEVTVLVEQIGRAIKENFGVVNPYTELSSQ